MRLEDARKGAAVAALFRCESRHAARTSNEVAAGGVAVVFGKRDDHSAGGFLNPRWAKMEQR